MVEEKRREDEKMFKPKFQVFESSRAPVKDLPLWDDTERRMRFQCERLDEKIKPLMPVYEIQYSTV